MRNKWVLVVLVAGLMACNNGDSDSTEPNSGLQSVEYVFDNSLSEQTIDGIVHDLSERSGIVSVERCPGTATFKVTYHDGAIDTEEINTVIDESIKGNDRVYSYQLKPSVSRVAHSGSDQVSSEIDMEEESVEGFELPHIDFPSIFWALIKKQ